MQIAINCRSFLTPHYTGIGRYAFNLLKYLAVVDRKNQYLLYARKRIFDFKRKLPVFDAPNFLPRMDYFNQGPARLSTRLDIYHAPSPEMLDVFRAKVVVTVHDLIFKTFPQGHTPQTIDQSQRQMADVVAKADKMICCSQSTCRDLRKYYAVPEEKLALIYQGVDKQEFFPLSAPECQEARSSLSSLGVSGPFILFVGTIEPRKNLENLLKSFARLRERRKFHGQLVVAGMKGWVDEHFFTRLNEDRLLKDVVFLGYVSNAQLRLLYNTAEVFVFPSFYEGFGFPLVEAFSCAAAVVTSNVSSCPEISGDAALQVDPHSVEAMAEAIAQVIEDEKLRRSLKEKALRRAQDFSFLKTAQETLAIYQEIVR